MGRSASCLKIITCGSDSADGDDLQVPENTSSSDKRGWSFRKRSARHRVLSNTVISETPSSANKESPESANLNFQPPDTSPVPEKIAVIQCTDEKPQLSASAESKVSETIVVTKDENNVDVPIEESVAIVIQAAVRGFLAQRELLKLKNVVKLQAAVRGHLVRQHAVGTLRCVQAIIKMQALVRARHTRLKSAGKPDKATSKTTEKEISVTKPTTSYISIEKLLSNRFAHQLMESTPKTTPIHIKCDPAKPNSAWNWLERWMSVSSAEPTPKPELITEQLERGENENLASLAETKVPHEGFYEPAESKFNTEKIVVMPSELADSKSNTKEIVMPSEVEENLIRCDADNFEFHVCHPTSSPAGDSLEQPLAEEITTSDAKKTSINANSLPIQPMQPEVNSQMVLNSLSREPVIGGEQPDQSKRSVKRLASEQLETEGTKFVYGSRKASNPTYIAAQTKFDELSSTANSNKSFNSLDQDGGVESNLESVSPGIDNVTRTKELNLAENLVPHNSRVQYGGSECGTELSVTSTLDSPDRSEVGGAEHEHEAKVSEEEICNPNRTKVDDVEAKDASTNSISNLSHSVVDQPEKLDGVKGESADPIVVADTPQVELKPERSQFDIQREQDAEAGGPACRSSPEASPRSHITVPESQGTPASQLSVKAKKNRTDNSSSNQKRKSLSAGKRSPSNPSRDSGARNSVEQLPKDQKNGKRRNSFGSTRPDHTDEEPRDSSSSNSLPHFMQATESARAKINANNSPRSSPDVQDRDFIKKRQSLPGADGRQGSPRVQRSISQAQGAKGNGGPVVHEKKWQR